MKYLFLIATFFTIYNTTSQTSVKSYSLSSSDSYNGYKYDYSVTVKYKMSDAGYGNSPTSLKVGFSNFMVTEIYYNGKRASSYLKNRNFPISQKLQADLSGSVSVKKGSLSMSYSYKLGWVSNGSLDNYDLTASDKDRLFKTFGKEVTCNDINIQMNSANVTNLGVSFIGSVIDEMKAQMRTEQEQAKKTETKTTQVKVNKQNSYTTSKTNTTATQTKNNYNTQQVVQKKESTTAAERIQAQREAQLAAFKAEQARIERQNILKQQALANAVTTASQFAGGFSEGVFTDLRVAANYRISENITDEDGNEDYTFIDMVTYDLGIGVGRNGFFSVGYGTPESDYREGSLFKIGMGFDIINLLPQDKYGRYGITIGIEGEIAFGSTETIEDSYSDIITEDGTLYGGAVTIRLFEVLYLGVGYGFISSDESGPSGNKTFKGNYSNTIIGLNIPF